MPAIIWHLCASLTRGSVVALLQPNHEQTGGLTGEIVHSGWYYHLGCMRHSGSWLVARNSPAVCFACTQHPVRCVTLGDSNVGQKLPLTAIDPLPHVCILHMIRMQCVQRLVKLHREQFYNVTCSPESGYSGGAARRSFSLRRW